MKSLSRFVAVLFVVNLGLALVGCGTETKESQPVKMNATEKVLIFSKTMGYRHKSIEPGTELLKQALVKKGIEVTVSEDAAIFNDTNLSEFSALVFLNTTGDILNQPQQVAMERYIQAGGGFVGIHAATDTEWRGDWIWYRRLVGAVFASHPNTPSNVQTARIQVINKSHASTTDFPDNFLMADEWYDFESLSDRRIDLMKVDETSYNGGGHNGYHPIAWYHDFDGGRSFYTGIGHNAENFKKPLYMKHLLGGIEYAIGNNVRDYTKSRPEPNRFVKETLLDNLKEPVSLDITQDGNGVIFIERKGQVHWFDTQTNNVEQIGKVDVFSAVGFGEFGLLTVALDPNFATNQFVYMMYNVPSNVAGAGPLQRVSRFTIVDGKLDNSSVVNMLETSNEDTCCHTGGNMEFDGEGNLYIALGDNTNPFEAFGVGPADFRDGRDAHDAYRSSGNTQDFRGKILRIKPQADGSYTIPQGNLFADAAKGKPEIYVMGTRNPYTLAFDDQEKTLYYGDVGPDSKADNDEHGSKGYDEVNRVRKAGNFGWPLFIANNKSYRQFNYDTKKPGKWNNPLSPRNTSPRNTGLERLPPAQPAYIWYPYSQSAKFPELGAGSRNALVAGVYRTKKGEGALPSYYDGGLFISDFMRRWVKVVFSDKNGDIYKIEEFAPEAELIAPIDLKFSAKGQLYVLEYGAKWHANNPDARLSRLVYTGAGNRAPTAKIQTAVTQGVAPLTVDLSAVNSTDPDLDPLTFSWQLTQLTAQQSVATADFTGAEKKQGLETVFNIQDNGRYAVALTAIDKAGATHTAMQLIEVGNAPPSIDISVKGNQDFIWPNISTHEYQVNISDLEDGVISQDSAEFAQVDIALVKNDGAAVEKAVGHLANDPFGPGRAATKKHLCIGCHQEQAVSVGPSFQKIADKYASLDNAMEYLKNSIASGSTGKWGQHQMPAHDFLSDQIRTTLSQYILLNKSKVPSLPLTGKLPVVSKDGHYALRVSYTDQVANGMSAIKRQNEFALRSATLLARELFESAGKTKGIVFAGGGVESVIFSGENTTLSLGTFDLTQVKGLQIKQKYLDWLPDDAQFSLRMGSKRGKVIASGKFTYGKNLKPYADVDLTLAFAPINEKTPLFLTVTLPEVKADTATANIFSVSFIHQ
ncbi:ThuA domain-containing protein [Paraglaciecola sp. L3A3]|uniref:ThuA domain-containing protein n=1 Tax=Paraglaciecola sp. L3A3 TaxID=2686358 RepID=UPI00131C4852|nr:ThuA domain-containing protein [Paraglaciecola sp. L3A3]